MTEQAVDLETIKLTNQDAKGRTLEAVFLPQFGMNLVSYSKQGFEVIDGETIDLFTERFAGLGALIGPHFHRRDEKQLPAIKGAELFPHIEKVQQKGVADPFSHGVARYVPWSQYKQDGHRMIAILTGEDQLGDVKLKDLEGQNFKMVMEASLEPHGLEMVLKVSSELPSVCGLHYYYKKGAANSFVHGAHLQSVYKNSQGDKTQVPQNWLSTYRDGEGVEVRSLHLPLGSQKEDIDFTFYPESNFSIMGLGTEDYLLSICRNHGKGQSWQVYSPKEEGFACIEPISAQSPRQPEATESMIDVCIQIGSVHTEEEV